LFGAISVKKKKSGGGGWACPAHVVDHLLLLWFQIKWWQSLQCQI